jgi:cellulose synthase/poly-beta-1,6-N-acetylglucosamine synthase-like glycosyltransferase
LPTTKAVTDDFLIPLNIAKRGFRTKYEREAHAYEKGADSISAEFRRKVRIGAQNFNTIAEIVPLLHPRYGFVAFALWSHKIIRWCVPFLLLGLIAATVVLASHTSFYAWTLRGFGVFVVTALAGYMFEKLKVRVGLLTFPYYFLAMNAALLVGFLRFAFKKQRPTWEVVR